MLVERENLRNVLDIKIDFEAVLKTNAQQTKLKKTKKQFEKGKYSFAIRLTRFVRRSNEDMPQVNRRNKLRYT
jgi:hypothetical protein